MSVVKEQERGRRDRRQLAMTVSPAADDGLRMMIKRFPDDLRSELQTCVDDVSSVSQQLGDRLRGALARVAALFPPSSALSHSQSGSEVFQRPVRQLLSQRVHEMMVFRLCLFIRVPSACLQTCSRDHLQVKQQRRQRRRQVAHSLRLQLRPAAAETATQVARRQLRPRPRPRPRKCLRKTF